MLTCSNANTINAIIHRTGKKYVPGAKTPALCMSSNVNPRRRVVCLDMSGQDVSSRRPATKNRTRRSREVYRRPARWEKVMKKKKKRKRKEKHRKKNHESKQLILPALLHRLAYPLDVFFPVVLVQVRGFYVGRRRCVRIVEETAWRRNTISRTFLALHGSQ